MKRLFYAMAITSLLIACNKEEPTPVAAPQPPQPVNVTTQDLIGTWIYDNTASGTTEVIEFMNDIAFHYSDNIEDILSETYLKGTYQISPNGRANGGCEGKVLDFTFFKVSSNSFTITDNTNGESHTFSKLVGKAIELEYQKDTVPTYAEWVEGEITSYKSHNTRTATVDARSGKITAMSEGVTLIDAVTTEGTAVVLVKTGGLIPDYADAIGCTQDEVKDIYGVKPSESYEAYLLYRDEAKSVQFDFSMRTKQATGVVVKYGNYKGFSRDELVEYLKTKYYLHKEYSDKKVFINHADYDQATVTITWDNEKELEFQVINRDLFEDFSIAIGKSRDEIEHVYGEDLKFDRENTAEIRYIIKEDLLGYAGVDKMSSVKFTFGDSVVVAVLVKLKNLTEQEIADYLVMKYGNPINSDDEAKYHYDPDIDIEIAHWIHDNEVEYYIKD